MTNLIIPQLISGSIKQWRIQQHEALLTRMWEHMGNDTIVCPLLNTQWDELSTTFVTRRSTADITGTASINGTTTLLTDTTVNFLALGVKPGGLLRNTTNSETAQIISVTATTVVSDAFTTTWDSSDGYTIVGGILATFTLAGAPLAVPVAYEGLTPVFKLDGSAEWWETPNIVDGFWLGGADDTAPQEPAYTWMFWVKVVVGATEQTLMAKTAASAGTGTDWYLSISGAESARVRNFDDSANQYIGQLSSTTLVAGIWVHVAITKLSAASSDDYLIYENGVLVASNDDELVSGAGYTAQENGTAVVRIGSESDGGAPYASTFAGGALGPSFSTSVRSAEQVLNVYREQAPYLGIKVD